MLYESTRGGTERVSFAEAVKRGIAPNGGLYVPTEEVYFDSLDLASMATLSYKDLACEILKHFAGDFTEQQIRECVERAYSDEHFPEGIAPISKLSSNLSVLELWHGPTCAFKDMALQILPEFLSKSREITKESDEIVILTATSGDTGKAALEGFRDVEGTRIIVYYPVDGVSEMQKRQMITQEGKNVSVLAVEGNFDDAQTGVKRIFTNQDFAALCKTAGYKLSSANSINWGRLLPQIIYYFHAYFSLVQQEEISLGTKINFVVPTGNFGNILAAYYARKCGLPVNKIICAANSNNVVADFMSTGTYDRNRPFHTTISPAMDILISSNLERLLYDVTGRDAETVRDCMASLQAQGCYSVDKKTINSINNIFWASSASETQTEDTIRSVYEQYHYLVDPHTAVGVDVYDKYVISTGDMTKTVAVSTASPFKFNKSVVEALLGQEAVAAQTEFELLTALSQHTDWEVPTPLQDLDKKEILHKDVCQPKEMMARVATILDLPQEEKKG